MTRVFPARTSLLDSAEAPPQTSVLLRQLTWLVIPLLAEQMLHMAVGLTDVYLAGHLPRQTAAAQAAVGTIAYVLWLFGLIAGALGTGSTALVARAVGARHRSLANSVSGQTVTTSLVIGLALGVFCFAAAGPVARMTGLTGDARHFAFVYLRIVAISLPVSTLMLAANACLRGAGDTLTPAIAMVSVDVINVVLSASLARGWFGLPELGYVGIAIGTATAYTVGGVLVFAILIRGRGVLRLYWRRMRPHWNTLRRILRIGLPAGLENVLHWGAQFVILRIINQADPSNVMGSAHICTIRVESLSFLFGFAISIAAGTIVGQSLGAGLPRRAARAAYLAYAVGASAMGAFGLLFIFFPHFFAHWLSSDAQVASLTASCLRITGAIQIGFAASLIFGGALRGAGDTLVVMAINLVSVLGLRLVGVLMVAYWWKLGLTAIWVVLSAELLIRGGLVFLRFAHGGWRMARV